MRLSLAAPALAFVLVAAGPTSAQYKEEQAAPVFRSAPNGGWAAPSIGRQPWMGYPYRD